jgi:hypothetical protein
MRGIIKLGWKANEPKNKRKGVIRKQERNDTSWHI